MQENQLLEFGVKALIFRDNKFLVMHKSGVKEDLWELPGGRMEFGETAEQTIYREIIEETGLKAIPIKLLDTWDLIRGDHHITGIIYLCTIEEGQIILSDEHDAYKWIRPDEKSLEYVYGTFKSRMKNWDWEEILKDIRK